MIREHRSREKLEAYYKKFMVGGVGPVVGVPLPFISYGGTSLMVCGACIGTLMNIGRQGYVHQPPDKPVPQTPKAKQPRLYLVKK